MSRRFERTDIDYSVVLGDGELLEVVLPYSVPVERKRAAEA